MVRGFRLNDAQTEAGPLAHRSTIITIMQQRTVLLLLVVLLGLTAVTRPVFSEEDAEPLVGDIDTAKTDQAVKGSEVYDTFAPEERAALAQSSEKHEFQAEVSRLMDIIINSLYSNREIFLRELISNAADALDKIRYLSLTDPSQLSTGSTLDIKISFDKDHKTLTITDTGVGMNKTQLIQNLGIVARSGTTEFLKASQSGTDALSLIGQFGVGFYSVYLVADRVTVASKANGDDQHVWESTAQSTFTIAKDPRGDTLGRGTQIVLHLKEDALEFTNEANLEKIVSKYSEFINFPIYLQVSKEVEKEVPVEAEAKDEEKKDDDVSVSEEEDDKKDEPKTKKVKEWVKEWKRLNEAKAIWTRAPKDVTEEEYAEFYKSLTKDDSGHLSKVHFTAEGEIAFKAILYIPKKAQPGLYDRFYDKSTSLKLYVRRVLISDEFEDFLPRYLSFIRGVVDSEDLPLNVSRETLAQSKVLRVMGKKITRKVLDLLTKLAQDSKKAEKDDENEEAAEAEKEEDKKENQYDLFWKQFGKSIKLGVIDDKQNKQKLQKLLRFQTSKSDGAYISLEEYVDRMKENQKAIFYITGESLESVKNSPFLETLTARDIEVVYMTDPLDEYVTQQMSEFDGTALKSVTKEGLDIDGDKKNLLKKMTQEFKPLTEWLKKTYGDRVEKVTVSNRIAKSPCVLVTSQYGWSANMERIMRAQTFGNPEQQAYMMSRKTMEINPRHPIIRELQSKVAAGASDTSLVDLANLLYDGALINSGFVMKETNDFAARLNRVIANGLGVDPEAPVEAEPEQDLPDETPAAKEEESEAETVSEDELKDEEPAASTTASETTHDEL